MWLMTFVIVINLIFEVNRPSETLFGLLDLNVGFRVIFVISKLIINYILLPIYCLILDINLINDCKIANKLR